MTKTTGAFILLVALLLASPHHTANADDTTQSDAPLVTLRGTQIRDGLKTIAVRGKSGTHVLQCSVSAAGCLTPQPGAPYFLLKQENHVRMPGAKQEFTLAWIQDWTTKYPGAENIALIPQIGGGLDQLGLYKLISSKPND